MFRQAPGKSNRTCMGRLRLRYRGLVTDNGPAAGARA